MPEPYLQLRDRVEHLAATVSADNERQIACSAGCCDCCVGGLTMVAVEAVVLGAELGLTPAQVLELIEAPPVADDDRCALLDGKGHCRAYSARPIVCRTEGLPLSYPAPAGIVSCEKNFQGITLDRKSAFDMTNLETALFAVNLDYCRRNSADPLGRVSIDRLAEVAGINPNCDK